MKTTDDFDPDAPMQLESSAPTKTYYLKKLERARAYLEGEINKLSGKSGRPEARVRWSREKAKFDRTVIQASIP